MQRTGTTTLGEILLILGYNVVATVPNLAEYLMKGDKEYVLRFAEKFDAFQDLPWIFLYKELDQKFPGSKFILTSRNEESWITSMVSHFGQTDTPMRRWAYGNGCPVGNEELYCNVFRKHYQEVKDYFKGREKDLLEINLSASSDWQPICQFLGHPLPNKKFPHANKSKEKYNKIDKIKNIIRRITPKIFRTARVKLLTKLRVHKGINRFNTEINPRNLVKKHNDN